MNTPNTSFVETCIKRIDQKAFYNAYWRTFSLVPAATDELRTQVFRLRHAVYCAENNFFDPLKYPDAMERDAFDDRALHWLLMHKTTGEAVGTIRLLLPDGDRPLVSFELQKSCDHPLLQIENRVLGLCEISRFCMAQPFRRRFLDGHLLPSWYDQENGTYGSGTRLFRRRIPYAPLGLLRAVFEAALDHNLSNCLIAIEARQAASFGRVGLLGRTLGPFMEMHGLQQQPLILNIKSVLDNMADVNPACWQIMTDRGKLQQQADSLWHKSHTDEQADAVL